MLFFKFSVSFEKKYLHINAEGAGENSLKIFTPIVCIKYIFYGLQKTLTIHI